MNEDIVIDDRRLKGLEDRCSVCNSKTISDGRLYGVEGRNELWAVGFECPLCQDIAPVWRPKYDKIIKEVLADWRQDKNNHKLA